MLYVVLFYSSFVYTSVMAIFSIYVTGWMSIGLLDGTLYSISPDGDMRKFLANTANDSVSHVGPDLDYSGFSIYVAKTIVEGKLIKTTGDYTYVSAKK